MLCASTDALLLVSRSRQIGVVALLDGIIVALAFSKQRFSPEHNGTPGTGKDLFKAGIV